jgi:pSer/pThr/pTyr-binding forkhead associated (FHA) protein
MDGTHLLVIDNEMGQREWILDASVYFIGRSPKCQIQIFSSSVSRYHATLIQIPLDIKAEEYCYCIIDGNLRNQLRSKNGLFVNGEPVEMHYLKNRDRIMFGQVSAAYYSAQSDVNENSQVAMVWQHFPEMWISRYEKMFSLIEERLEPDESLGVTE